MDLRFQLKVAAESGENHNPQNANIVSRLHPLLLIPTTLHKKSAVYQA
jgi:hypothetical protein